MRDGRPYSPSGLREVEILSGVPEACQRLRRDGFLLVVVTKQPEVARGHLTRQTVEEIHGLLRSRIPLDDVRVCYHDDRAGCCCRRSRLPAMRCETVILLTYYYRQEDRDHRMLRHIIGAFCPTYLPFDLHLYVPLKRMFRRVIVYDFLRRRAELGLKAMNDEVLALVREERPKYVLWTSFYDDIRNITLEAIRKEGATVVGWFFDDEWRFSSYSKYWIPYLDYCVTNAISVVPRYRQLGARVIQTVPNSGVTVDV